jgi:hypothetical protein
LGRQRLEVDMIKFSGPGFPGLDNRPQFAGGSGNQSQDSDGSGPQRRHRVMRQPNLLSTNDSDLCGCPPTRWTSPSV